MARLELEQLRKSYGQVDVVDGVSLAIEEGELVSLLGPSGCGKTTILRMIAGLLEPSGGRIRVAGEDITRTPVARRDIGLVFQSYALFPHMTVFENVAFGLRRRGVRGGSLTTRVEEALGMVQLAHLADRFPRQLSGGQQQRVALARAIAPRPRLLLFDEPLSNLDAQLRDRMQIELKQLQKELGITSVFVTHDQSEAMSISDRICILAQGRIQQFSSPEAIYRDPANAFVATFIGRSNRYAGPLRDGSIAIGGGLALPVRPGEAAQGTEVEAVIRHEDIGVLPAGADGGLHGRVRLRSFIGSRVQYVADLAPGVEIVAEVDAAGPSGGFEPGQEVALKIDMDRAFVAPVAAGAGA
ncbi:ABC transporter ATP-binding protein [Leisingera daeponensis]|uniref:ABC transporter ATP-binding protein n=1 Tax=Leisingera daeponensis TaxID=405746 RepID=UPI001C98629D|nr:ABC transporter ATP-binding protein [Leisingera daeponensis]MBY6059052.1 ABC transporter ATP-binding protein [Leisingera daeponensis]